jgi:hypothetical protein
MREGPDHRATRARVSRRCLAATRIAVRLGRETSGGRDSAHCRRQADFKVPTCRKRTHRRFRIIPEIGAEFRPMSSFQLGQAVFEFLGIGFQNAALSLAETPTH